MLATAAPSHIQAPHTIVCVALVDSRQLRAESELLRRALHTAFNVAVFHNDWAIDTVLQSCTKVLSNTNEAELLWHAVATTSSGSIAGAVLGLPSRRSPQDLFCTTGWFFVVPSLPKDARRAVADQLIELTHGFARAQGFSGMLVEVGTEAGARFLERRHGYRQVEGPRGRMWIRMLGLAD